MDNSIRFLFILYFFFMGIISLYFSGFDPSSLLSVFGLVFAGIFYLVAASALQIAHKKDGRSRFDWLVLALYPFLIYLLIFKDFNQNRSFFWILPGYFYFSMITGGFLGGILLSPHLARWESFSKEEVEDIVDRGRGRTAWPFSLMSIGLIIALLLALTYVPLALWRDLKEVGNWQKGLFAILFSVGMIRVIYFSYRHTIFHIRRDPDLQQKYAPLEEKGKEEF
ncbi:MAG: hypothetical protein AB1585_04825 [Thermodesulfobacteriota bacterium]